MGKITILPETTKDPISLMGRRAGVCWGADVSSPDKNYKRGLDCVQSGHGRVMEFVNVESFIEGYSARVIREWYTHIGGSPTRLQSSTRDIDYSDFDYIVPKSLKNESDIELYHSAMKNIQVIAKRLEHSDIPREDVANILPLGMKTNIVDKRNVRNIMDMSRQRMCNRAYWEYRQMFKDYITALSEYSDEWKELISVIVMPKCETLGYCPEKHGCGKFPKKEMKETVLPSANAIKLPCGIGDTVYCVENDFDKNIKTATICERKVTDITLDEDDLWVRVDDKQGTYYSVLLFGNGIFKNYCEAEQKLAEWQKKSGEDLNYE